MEGIESNRENRNSPLIFLMPFRTFAYSSGFPFICFASFFHIFALLLLTYFVFSSNMWGKCFVTTEHSVNASELN